MNKDRKQLNIRVDDEFKAAVERIRRLSSPIPSVTEAVRLAVFAYVKELEEGQPHETRTQL